MPSFFRKMTDWLVVLTVSSCLIWFVLTGPTLPVFEQTEIELPDIGNLQRHVIKLSSSPRMAEFENLRPPARYIHRQLKQYGKAYYHPFKTAIGTVNNVMIDFGPETRNMIVIGAHYDSLHGMPGADGNASGVAGLIELARLLSAQDDLPVKVQLVAYALSEGQYFGTRDMGSLHHAESIKDQNKNVLMMISMDSIGYFSDKSGSQNYPYEFMHYFYPSSGNYIKIAGRLQDISAVRKIKKSFSKVSDLETRSLNAPELFSAIGRSDNISFWEKGFPAVLVTDTAGDRNPAYHTENDTAESLDYKRMAKVVQAVGQAVLDMTREHSSSHLVLARKKADH